MPQATAESETAPGILIGHELLFTRIGVLAAAPRAGAVPPVTRWMPTG